MLTVSSVATKFHILSGTHRDIPFDIVIGFVRSYHLTGHALK